MDLICPRCGEPWDIDCLHEEAELRIGGAAEYLLQKAKDPEGAARSYQRLFDEISKDFRTRGCAALVKFRATDQPCEMKPSGPAATRAAMASAAYDLCGPDIDGAAAMLEDWDRGY